jgi:hypothetical protein
VAKLIVAKLIVAKLIVGGERVATSVFQIVTGNSPRMTGHCVIVTEIMRSELMTAAAHGVTSKSVCVSPAVSAQCMATPPMTHVGHATTGGKSMKPTASTVNAAKSMEPTASAMPTTPAAPTVKSGKTTAAAVKSTTSTAPAVKPTASTPRPGDCRDVRHDAKRAHRKACRQNAYRSFLHGTIPSRSSKAVAVAARATATRTLPITVGVAARATTAISHITTVSVASF